MEEGQLPELIVSAGACKDQATNSIECPAGVPIDGFPDVSWGHVLSLVFSLVHPNCSLKLTYRNETEAIGTRLGYDPPDLSF